MGHPSYHLPLNVLNRHLTDIAIKYGSCIFDQHEYLHLNSLLLFPIGKINHSSPLPQIWLLHVGRTKKFTAKA